jgi:hypothetical protein
MHEFDSNGTKVIIGGRQSGKSTALIEWAKGDAAKRVVLCSTQQRANALIAMGLPVHQALSALNGTSALRGRGLEVAVDDALDYIYADLGVFPAVVTIDGEPLLRDPFDITAETPAELLLETALYYRRENERLLRIIRAQLDEELAS